jgi:hypothetical protein
VRRMRRTLLLLSLIPVAATGTLLGRTYVGTGSGSDAQLISQVVYGSQVAEQTLCVPPVAYRRALTPVGDGVVASVKANIHSVAPDYFTGSRLGQVESTLDSNCGSSLQGGVARATGGGVDSFSCPQVEIRGETANATCSAVEWSTSLVQGPSGVRLASPRSGLTLTDNLVKTANGWRITSEQIAFAPGQGP